ncbi:hypothetical protein ACFOEY_16005 [Paracandidimonas soli]|uniref:hypothetical protein n=1 Tax=Paracandidimonas soli TaxID=1917182 RepID=UPI0036243302
MTFALQMRTVVAGLQADALLNRQPRQLENPAQARLNLGVISTLMGEVFNTDNCTVTENSNGTSFRHLQGLQICLRIFGHGHSTWSSDFRFDNHSSLRATVSVNSSGVHRAPRQHQRPVLARMLLGHTRRTIRGAALVREINAFDCCYWKWNTL